MGDSFNLQTCTRRNPDFTITYNSGKTLEAMSIIASSNNSWVPLYVMLSFVEFRNLCVVSLNALVASTVPFPVWTGQDGVIFESSIKGIYTRYSMV